MRLIDADALMEKAEKTLYADHPFIRFMRSQVDNAPTVDAEPPWIPCEERLPNEDEIIYNGVGIDGERKLSDRVLAIDPNCFIRAGYFIKSCKPHKYKGKGAKNKYSKPLVACWEFGEHYMSDPSNWVCGCGFDAVAWMSLPESYEEERRKNEKDYNIQLIRRRSIICKLNKNKQ